MRMTMLVMVVGACASSQPSRTPIAQRCTVRPTERGLFVDGERMSSADAAAYCRRTEGAVVILEENPARTEWSSTREALERGGVRVYVAGRLCNLPGALACIPRLRSSN